LFVYTFLLPSKPLTPYSYCLPFSQVPCKKKKFFFGPNQYPLILLLSSSSADGKGKTLGWKGQNSFVCVCVCVCVCIWRGWFRGLGFQLRAPHLHKQALYHLSHTSSLFCSGYFGDEVSRTVCLGWPQTAILLISASQVTKIISVNHQHLAQNSFEWPGREGN
jgi:hypothetical protein